MRRNPSKTSLNSERGLRSFIPGDYIRSRDVGRVAPVGESKAILTTTDLLTIICQYAPILTKGGREKEGP